MGRGLPFEFVHRTILGSLSLLGLVILDEVHINRGPSRLGGMDVIGAITPKASNGHEFILVAIDYFTKWVEACSFKNVTQVAVTRFVKNNIICRYGMPEMLITDNASNLNNRMMDQLCQQFKIQHHNSAPYRPKMNGDVKAANQNVKKILSKMTETYKD
jgi:hypothetical protein